MNKRTFIKNISIMGMGIPVADQLENLIEQYEHLSPTALAEDEKFWEGVRGGYKLKPDYINLENGYYSFMPQEILENYIRHIREVNYEAAYYMRTKRFDDKKKMAAKLANLAGCSEEELVITRNTTESLDTIIAGFPWQAGDEAVFAEQDYGAMQDMFKVVAKRHGVVIKTVSLPNHPADDNELVNLYAKAITSKTKLLLLSHIVNISGQILPVRMICNMAHAFGVKVLVDGAHAFAHFQYKIPDLDCDYYGCSLHKWLSVPLGAGFLYVKKENIKDIWPLLGPDQDKKEDDIYKLNHTGTHPCATDLTIIDAIDFHNKLGAARKEERLRYLQQYWTKKVRSIPNIVLNTPAEDQRACAIANVGIKNMKPSDMAKILLEKYKVYTVAIERGNVQGCRITPSIYITPKDLDVLVNALKEMAAA
jgi:selenocysteine lyase/cysteine desulfurase